ncbi:MAG: DUF4870 domain-containing protein [Hydrogenibacillus schlegelii]|nr:DUF4870 domain-containing protein [Hydrogenibacillus schlegelii]
MTAGEMGEREARNWAMALHLSPFFVFLMPSVPFLAVLVPLGLWLWKKDAHPMIDRNGKAVLNFQLTVLLLGGGLVFLPMLWMFPFRPELIGMEQTVPWELLSSWEGRLTVGTGVPVRTGLILIYATVVLALFLLWLIAPIVGAVRAKDGRPFRYPIAISFFR